jgi:endonuclease G, mitochondrial
MDGYDPTFLTGFSIPLPRFTAELDGAVLRRETLQARVVATYPNYSVVMHAAMRAPIFAALNIDQRGVATHSTSRTDRWRIDSRIGADYQLNNDYYHRNRWDRGHLARRESAGWGVSARAAQFASDETFYYSNATLQHENFNQDEWLALEDWVLGHGETRDGRIISFSIPYFGGDMRSVTPQGRPTAFVPAAFLKIVAYVDKTDGTLQTRAFKMLQDADALRDKRGRKQFNFQRYQITTSEVEELTGLVFDEQLYHTNPLYFHPSAATAETRDRLGVNHLPERIEVDAPEELVDTETHREYIADDEVEVYLAAAMVDPSGNEREGEWISLLNLTGAAIDFRDWTLSDTKRSPLRIGDVVADCVRQPGESLRVHPVTPLRLPNSGGVIALYDDRGRRIDRLKYTARDVTEGFPVNFFCQPSMSETGIRRE